MTSRSSRSTPLSAPDPSSRRGSGRRCPTSPVPTSAASAPTASSTSPWPPGWSSVWPWAVRWTSWTARPATATAPSGPACPRCSTCPGRPWPSSATSSPSASARRSGLAAGGNSLDNTFRVARLEPTDWVLLDIRVLAVHGGFGHGAVLLWSESRPAPGHRQPIRHRPLLEGSVGMMAPTALWHDRPLRRVAAGRAAGLVPGAGRPRLHRRLVQRGRRGRRLHPADPGVGVGARAPAGHGHRPRLHPGPRLPGPDAWARWRRPPRVASCSAWAARPTSSSSVGTTSRSRSPTSAPGTWSASCGTPSAARR